MTGGNLHQLAMAAMREREDRAKALMAKMRRDRYISVTVLFGVAVFLTLVFWAVKCFS